MKKLSTLFIIPLVAILFTGCLKEPCGDAFGPEYNNMSYDFSKHSQEVMANVMSNVISKEKVNIVVTEYVDLSSLKNSTKLGYILSSSMKDKLVNSGNFNVIEAQVAKYFNISQGGVSILSRDAKKLKEDSLSSNWALVGSYTYTTSQLLVYSKLINLNSGIIEGSYQSRYPLNCELNQMLNIE
jgi:TolB-like protein